MDWKNLIFWVLSFCFLVCLIGGLTRSCQPSQPARELAEAEQEKRESYFSNTSNRSNIAETPEGNLHPASWGVEPGKCVYALPVNQEVSAYAKSYVCVIGNDSVFVKGKLVHGVLHDKVCMLFAGPEFEIKASTAAGFVCFMMAE